MLQKCGSWKSFKTFTKAFEIPTWSSSSSANMNREYSTQTIRHFPYKHWMLVGIYIYIYTIILNFNKPGEITGSHFNCSLIIFILPIFIIWVSLFLVGGANKQYLVFLKFCKLLNRGTFNEWTTCNDINQLPRTSITLPWKIGCKTRSSAHSLQ